MLAHSDDLRSEGMDAAMVGKVQHGWRNAGLAARESVLAAFAEQLTLEPGAMCAADLAPLRAQGLDDRAIHDAVQVIGYFNYINRVADGLGLELEPDMDPPTT